MTDIMLGRKPPPRARLGFRFAVFGLVIVLVIGLLTTRLFYLQVVQGGYYAGLSQDNRARTDPASIGRAASIYDRAGRQLAINMPSYVVDDSAGRSAVRRARRGRQPTVDAAPDPRRRTSSSPSTATRTRASTSSASRRTCPSDVARIIVEESTRPARAWRSASKSAANTSTGRSCRTSWATRARSRPTSSPSSNGDGAYLNDDQIGKTGVEATFEDVLRGTYGQQEVEQDALGRVTAHGRR